MLVISRQTIEKGTHKVIRALNFLRKKFDIELTVVGDGEQHPLYFRNLESIFTELKDEMGVFVFPNFPIQYKVVRLFYML